MSWIWNPAPAVGFSFPCKLAERFFLLRVHVRVGERHRQQMFRVEGKWSWRHEGQRAERRHASSTAHTHTLGTFPSTPLHPHPTFPCSLCCPGSPAGRKNTVIARLSDSSSWWTEGRARVRFCVISSETVQLLLHPPSPGFIWRTF